MDLTDIEKLAELLKVDNEEIEPDEQVVYPKTGKVENVKPEIIEKGTNKEPSIHNFGIENNEESDWKTRPEFSISYKQTVNPEDVFLQIDGKTPSISDCDQMLVTIFLPSERKSTIDLKTTPTSLSLSSSMYCLQIDLPRVVDPKRGSANWDSSKEKLVVQLFIDMTANNFF